MEHYGPPLTYGAEQGPEDAELTKRIEQLKKRQKEKDKPEPEKSKKKVKRDR